MTAQVIPAAELPVEVETRSATPNLAWLWLSTLAVFFVPRRVGRRWLAVSPARAGIIAAINLICVPLWVWIFAASAALWSGAHGVRLVTPNHPADWARIPDAFRAVPHAWLRDLHNLSPVDRLAGVSLFLFTALVALLLPFFLLLPFAARPGPNRACIRHTARTVLLSFGGVHFWGMGLSAVFFGLMFLGDGRNEYFRVVTPILLTGVGLLLWHFFALVAAVRRDYRSPRDFPEPHDPWCDDCGYNLIAAELDGRCPECGRPVADSLGSHARPPTDWERRPSPAALATIVRQVVLLVRRPRDLFFSMPALTGQPAAQRWLLISMAAVGLAALPIVPIAAWLRDAEWSIDILSGALAMAIVWAFLALMMVGIETAGIATYSRMKAKKSGFGRGVYLATAAKVTSYSSTLMLWWVLLGGIQLLCLIYWADLFFLGHLRISLRTQQVILALSLSGAHIGGLLWYELTVYRGIRAVQFANK